MSICEKCRKDVSNKRRHKYRCPGRKASRPKMPKKRRGTGLDPGKIVIVGGTEEQKRIVKMSLEKGELDE
jgi:hypothetical protein